MKLWSKLMAALTATVLCSVIDTLPAHFNTDDTEEITGTFQKLEYISYDDHVEITGCEPSLTMLTIPVEIDGLPVTSIGDGAFSGYRNLTSVTIPEGVTSIGNGAFEGCNVLVDIRIPKSVKRIGYFAFSSSLVQQDVRYAGTKNEWASLQKNQKDGYWMSYYWSPSMHYGLLDEIDASLGDFDNNGKVDAADAVILLVYAAEAGAGETTEYLENADIDGNGTVDAADAAEILSYAALVGAGDAGMSLSEFVFGSYVIPNATDTLLNTAVLAPQESITITVYDRINASGKEQVDHTFTLQDSDIATLEKFAAEHFPENATMAQKLYITHQWIHFNTDYAYSEEQSDEIADVTCVDAVFNHRLGQCLQYNGAMAALLAYYGFDVYMYHATEDYSTIVTIDDLEYNVECGNYGKDGSRQSFFE